MRNAYIIDPIPGARLLPFLAPQSDDDNRLFQEVPWKEYTDLIHAVDSPGLADLLIAPHEYATLRKNPSYLDACVAVAVAARKPLLISAYQDDPAPIEIPGTIVLRASAYKSQLRSSEVIMPAYVEDLGRMYGSEPIGKPDKATVGFMGKAGFATLKDRARYVVRNYIVRRGPDREGLYFRRHALGSLARDPRITLDAVVRKRFSGHRKTIEAGPEEIRERYVRSLKDSIFTLAPRGDGNFSLRFFEALSVGRIPILIDTDVPLPLEDRIDYDAFIVRVPWKDVDRTGEIVADFFDRTDDERIQEMQRLARRTFEDSLTVPSFLREFFSRVPKTL